MALAMAHSDQLQHQLQLCPVSSRFCYYFYITCENNNRAARGERRRRSNGQINTPESDSWINTSVKVQIVRALPLPDDADDELRVGRTPRIHMSPVVTRTTSLPHLHICNCPRVYLCLCWHNNGKGNKELGTWHWLSSSRFRSESFICWQVLLLLLLCCFLSGNFH